ncbi:hypothetical protein AKJ16_DCAP02414, partial [Drosera capensis]
ECNVDVTQGWESWPEHVKVSRLTIKDTVKDRILAMQLTAEVEIFLTGRKTSEILSVSINCKSHCAKAVAENRNQNRKKMRAVDSDEKVEEMLREAEDAVMLKLSINSHMAHVKPSDLQPDLDSRFQALKSGTKGRQPKIMNTTVLDAEELGEQSSVVKEETEDDLFTRFAALKASIPKPSVATTLSLSGGTNQADGNLLAQGDIDKHDDEDEIRKIIMWAMDAARLDLSPPSDNDEDEKEGHEGGDDNED